MPACRVRAQTTGTRREVPLDVPPLCAARGTVRPAPRARAARMELARGFRTREARRLQAPSRAMRRPPRRSAQQTRSACLAGPAARLAGSLDLPEFPRSPRFVRPRSGSRRHWTPRARRSRRPPRRSSRGVGRARNGAPSRTARSEPAARVSTSLPQPTRTGFRSQKATGSRLPTPRRPETRLLRRGRSPTRQSRVQAASRRSLRRS